MTATDELRRMLDERGAEYRVSATGYSIDIGPYITAYANRSDTTLDVSLRKVTPEQAIEATLGRGTCHNLAGQDEYGEWGFCCSECGARPKYDSGEVHIPSSGELPDGTVWLGDSWVPWRYCPNCGRRVVGE